MLGKGGYGLRKMWGPARQRPEDGNVGGSVRWGQQPCAGKMDDESRMKFHSGKFLLQRGPLKQGKGRLGAWIHGEF